MKEPIIWIFAGLPLVVLVLGATGFDTVVITLLGILAVVLFGPLYCRWLYLNKSGWLTVVAGLVLLTSAVANASLEWWSFRLRVGYSFSKDRMNEAAARLHAGKRVATPCWVGVLRVKKAEIYRNGITCLWTHPLTSDVVLENI